MRDRDREKVQRFAERYGMDIKKIRDNASTLTIASLDRDIDASLARINAGKRDVDDVMNHAIDAASYAMMGKSKAISSYGDMDDDGRKPSREYSTFTRRHTRTWFDPKIGMSDAQAAQFKLYWQAAQLAAQEQRQRRFDAQLIEGLWSVEDRDRAQREEWHFKQVTSEGAWEIVSGPFNVSESAWEQGSIMHGNTWFANYRDIEGKPRAQWEPYQMICRRADNGDDYSQRAIAVLAALNIIGVVN